MEISRQAIQPALNKQPGSGGIETVKEGQIFTGKAVTLLPGQMAEIAVFGQKITAQLEAPLKTGERYFFQVASLDKGIRLRVLGSSTPMEGSSEQASALLEKLQLPASKEAAAFTAYALESGRSLSKGLIQTVSGWLGKSGLEDGMEAIRFMMSRNLPMNEQIFRSLTAARSADSLTDKMAALQQMLPAGGEGKTALAAIERLLNPKLFQGGAREESINSKTVQLVHALQSTGPAAREAANELRSIVMPNAAVTKEGTEELLAAVVKNLSTLQKEGGQGGGPIQKMKEALIHLAERPVSAGSIAAFKEAVSLAVPIQHPNREAVVQQAEELAEGLKPGRFPDAKAVSELFQIAAAAAVSAPDRAAARMSILLGTDVFPPKESPPFREAFRFLGVDHEAVLALKGPEEPPQTVKQELIKLMAETMPAPVREAAEQLVGRLNAQHILSTESGPLQQLVMQSPLQFGEFRGDVTIKWQGRKKPDGKIDADFCRVLFYVEMPNLRNTVIDMQVQNRIIHLTILAEASPAFLKKVSGQAADSLKEALEAGGYRLSGIQFKEPTRKEAKEGLKPPLARIMEDEGYTEVDIRI